MDGGYFEAQVDVPQAKLRTPAVGGAITTGQG
jgi:hypothetical protein